MRAIPTEPSGSRTNLIRRMEARDILSIRAASDLDLPAIADLVTRAEPDDPPVTVEVLAWLLARAIPERPHPNLVVEVDERIVAWASLRGIPNFAPALLILEVHPEHRRRGIGSALLDAVLSAAGGEPEVAVEVSAAAPDAAEFATQRGFVEEARRYESTLDLTTFDPAPYSEVEDQLMVNGYRFSTLELEDGPELRQALYRLAEATTQDVPTPWATLPTTFEEWTRDWLDAPHAIPATFALVFSGAELVGFSYVISQSEGVGYMWMTGVARAHRSRGLGLAVKVRALRAAQARGLREVLTNNDPGNAPMLAINRRLGFRDRPARIALKKSLQPAQGV